MFLSETLRISFRQTIDLGPCLSFTKLRKLRQSKFCSFRLQSEPRLSIVPNLKKNLRIIWKQSEIGEVMHTGR
jgi:hypothetical protein